MRFLHFLTGLVHSHKRWLFFVWSTIVVWFLWSDVGVANTPANQQVQTDTINILNRLLSFLSAILGLASMLIGGMLHPNWTDGTIVGLDGDNGVLKKMWILISNVVYFVFALIFVGIAFLTIYRGESYALKDKLPRFIAGILIVPFSWFIVQFVISISSLLTYSVLSLPFETFPEMNKDIGDVKIMCKNITIDADPESKHPISPDIGQCKDSVVQLKDIIDPATSEGIFGIMSIYTYGIMEIQNISKIQLTNAGSIVKTLMSLSSTVLFDLFFVVVYMLIIIALTLALFVRGIYMWMYAIFAPAFGLIWFFGKEKEGLGEGKFGIMQFINLSLIPVYVGAALAFGLVFIYTAGKVTTDAKTGQSGTSLTNNDIIVLGESKDTGTINKQGEKIYSTTSTFLPKKDGGVAKITFIGPQGTLIGGDATPGTLRKELQGYAGIAGVLLLRLFGLAILYMTVMLALKSSKVTASIAEPFEAFGKSIGGMLAKAPLNTPIIPTGTKHGNISLAGLQNVGQKLEQAALNAGRQSADAFGDDLVKELFPNLNKAIQNLSNAALKFEQAGNNFTADSLQQLEPELKNMNADTWNRARNNPKIKAMLEALYGENVVKMEFEQAKTRIATMTESEIRARINTHNKDLNDPQITQLAQSARAVGSQGTQPSGGDTSTPPSFDLTQLTQPSGAPPLQWTYNRRTVDFPASGSTDFTATNIAAKLTNLGIPKNAVNAAVLNKIYNVSNSSSWTTPSVDDIKNTMT